jgi:hypothetical protein
MTDHTYFMNKDLITVGIVCVILGAAVGFYFGYDVGFQRALEQLQ